MDWFAMNNPGFVQRREVAKTPKRGRGRRRVLTPGKYEDRREQALKKLGAEPSRKALRLALRLKERTFYRYEAARR